MSSAMSDGGAGALVKIVSVLGRTRAGRVILVVMTFYVGVQVVVSRLDRATLVAIGVIFAGLMAVAIWFWRQRRRRRERASLYQWLAFFGLVLVASATALLLILRRRRVSTLAAPPSAEEVERLAVLAAAPATPGAPR